jgi:hypothetical protein
VAKEKLGHDRLTIRLQPDDLARLKIQATEGGSLLQDHLRQLIHIAVKDVRLPGETVTEPEVAAVFKAGEWERWKQAVAKGGFTYSLPEMIRLGMNKHLEEYLS